LSIRNDEDRDSSGSWIDDNSLDQDDAGKTVASAFFGVEEGQLIIDGPVVMVNI